MASILLYLKIHMVKFLPTNCTVLYVHVAGTRDEGTSYSATRLMSFHCNKPHSNNFWHCGPNVVTTTAHLYCWWHEKSPRQSAKEGAMTLLIDLGCIWTVGLRIFSVSSRGQIKRASIQRCPKGSADTGNLSEIYYMTCRMGLVLQGKRDLTGRRDEYSRTISCYFLQNWLYQLLLQTLIGSDLCTRPTYSSTWLSWQLGKSALFS